MLARRLKKVYTDDQLETIFCKFANDLNSFITPENLYNIALLIDVDLNAQDVAKKVKLLRL